MFTFVIQSCIVGMGCFLLMSLRTGTGITLRKSGLEWLIIVFVLLCVTSYLLSPYRFSTKMELVRIIVHIALLYWFLSFLNETAVLALMDWIIILGTIQSFFCLGQFYVFQNWRTPGSFFNPNLAASYLLASLAVSVVMMVWSRHPLWRRALYGIACALLMWAISTTGSRSAVVSLGVLFCAFVWMTRRKALPLVLALGIAVVSLLLIPNPIRERVLFASKSDIYVMHRPQIWQQSLEMILDHPLAGVTLGNYKYSTFRYQFPVEEAVGRYARTFVDPDNCFIEATAELGLPGFLCILFGAILVIRKYRDANRAFQSPDTRVALASAFLVLLVLASQGLFHDVIHSPPNAILGVLAVAIIAYYPDRSEGISAVSHFSRVREVFDGIEVGWGLALMLSVSLVVVFWPVFCLRPFLAFKHYESAGVHLAAGDLAEAQRDAERAIVYNSGQPFFFQLLGNIAMERFSKTQSTEDAKLALRAFSASVSMNRLHPRFYSTMSKYYEFMIPYVSDKEDYLKNSVENCKKAIALSPTDCFYRVDLALLLIRGGDYEKAIPELENALRLEPNFLTAQILLADVHDKLGHLTEAAEWRAVMERTRNKYRDHVTKNPYERKLLMDPKAYLKDKLG